MKQKKRFTLSCSLAALLAAALILCGCAPASTEAPSASSDPITGMAPSGVICETEDMGQGYVDRFLFFGESTTYHVKSRGVLAGGTETTQVWAPAGGTVCLDERIGSVEIVYPETGEELTLSEALSRKKPERMLLTFGLNGVVRKYTRGADYFKSCYRKLIALIRKSSPETEIFLGSCYPVAACMDVSNYSVDAAAINRYLDTINEWTLELAEEESLGYLAFAPLLKDSHGFLRDDLHVGDGIHLTKEAYLEVLYYIRTHDGYIR